MSAVVVDEQAPPHPSLLRVGMVIWLSSELMFFAGLFSAWFGLRAAAAEGAWPPEDVELAPLRTGVFTALLVASSFTMHLAVRAAESGERVRLVRFTALTFALGAVFLTNQALEYAELSFDFGSHAYGSIFYLMTGFHGLHVLGGLGLMAAVLPLGLGRGSRAPLAEHVAVSGYYWHFVDVVWVAMFTTIYVIG
ncbi:MAG: heme-copper oxidase subunit III [Acidimicrobiales bacterium]